MLSDLNPDLIGCYSAIADSPQHVHAAYASLSNDPSEYYRVREAFACETNLHTKAGYFIYLNRYCFNGLYRTDRQGRFNVPYGGKRTGLVPTLDELSTYSSVLANVKLASADFEEVVKRHVAEGDLVYLDPPYFSEKRRVFTSYTSATFGTSDVERFGELLHGIDASGAIFIATYLDGPEIAAIAGKWSSDNVTVLRRLSGFTAGRQRTQELVFTNSRAGVQ